MITGNQVDFPMSLNLLTWKVMQSALLWLFSQHKTKGFIEWYSFSSWLACFLFFVSCSRLNRNKLQVLPELLFQSNPKLGRLWVHFNFSSTFPSPICLWLSVTLSVCLSSVFWLFWCVTWSVWKHVRTFIQVETSSLAPGDTVPLCAPVGRWKTLRVSDVYVWFSEVKVWLEWMFCLDWRGIFYSRISFPRVFGV